MIGNCIPNSFPCCNVRWWHWLGGLRILCPMLDLSKGITTRSLRTHHHCTIEGIKNHVAVKTDYARSVFCLKRKFAHRRSSFAELRDFEVDTATTMKPDAKSAIFAGVVVVNYI